MAVSAEKYSADGGLLKDEGIVHRIAVISDTHGLLIVEVKEVLSSCDIILHGGDINRQEILDELGGFARLYAVRLPATGNKDK